MRKIQLFVLIFTLFTTSNVLSQDLIYKNTKGTNDTITTNEVSAHFKLYKDKVEAQLKSYQGNGNYDNNSIVINKDLLNKQLKDIFNQLIFGNSDLVDAASAFGLTINEDKTAISTNFNLPLNNTAGLKPEFINLGLNASGQGKLFNFYNDEAWQNKAGISLGAIWKLSRASRFYKLNKNEKDDLLRRRTYFMLLLHQNALDRQRFSIENFKLIKTVISLYDSGNVNALKSDTSNQVLIGRYPNYKSLFDKNDFILSYDFLNTELTAITVFFDRVNDEKKLDKFVASKLKAFDKENVKLYGHNNLWWLNTNISFSNNGFNFTDDNINVMNLEAFDENVLGIKLNADLNWSREDKTNIFYANAGLSYDKGSFMNSVLINGTPKVIQNSNNDIVIEDENGFTLGRLDQLKENFETGSIYGYFAWFGSKNKNIGFNTSFTHYYQINAPQGTDFKNNFSFLAGPLAKTKDGSTFGIDVGFANARYNTRIVNDFVVRLRAGIPFNIISAKKKEK